jgi:serine protease Do
MKVSTVRMNTLKIFLMGVALAIATPVMADPLPADKSTDPDLDLVRRLENAFVRVAAEASQSVVVITTTRTASARARATPPSQEEGEEFEGTPFEFFFRRHGLPVPQPRDVSSHGSGIILRADGYILTNSHVVEGADNIKVRLKDGREFSATRAGTDNRTDVAVLKIDAENLPVARLADSDQVRVGQWAIAIGAPYELDYTFTVGFVSAKGRSSIWSRGGSAYEDYIQTDASINPGNSGGPLCDIEGRVIGINTLIRGLNRGIGFAIPINMARQIADQIIEKGRIVRPWIGIQIEPLADNKELLATLKDIKDGVLVRAIYPDTPAAKSDLKPADIIIAVDGVAVASPRDLQRQILRKAVGEQVVLEVVRDGKPLKLNLQTGELPEEPQVAAFETPTPPEPQGVFGINVQTLGDDLARQFGLQPGKGVVVTDVQPGSVGEQKGLQHGDIILEVDRKPIATAGEFASAVQAGDARKGVLLYIRRGDMFTFVVLKEK